jgi:catechol 2,3-dioxygenase-like lactoylglutathione lyase family enzyme
MTISLKYCPITVDDVDAAIAFYRDALGLELLNDVASDGHRWVSFGFADQPGLAVVLSDPGAGRSPEDGDTLHRLVVKGSGPGPVVFATDDLDETFERVRASGAEVLQEPIDQQWGPRDCAFRDPSGNTVRISQAQPGNIP